MPPVRSRESAARLGKPSSADCGSGCGDGIRNEGVGRWPSRLDRKSTRLNSSHGSISYAAVCLKKKHHDHKEIKVHGNQVKISLNTSTTTVIVADATIAKLMNNTRVVRLP